MMHEFSTNFSAKNTAVYEKKKKHRKHQLSNYVAKNTNDIQTGNIHTGNPNCHFV